MRSVVTMAMDEAAQAIEFGLQMMSALCELRKLLTASDINYYAPGPGEMLLTTGKDARF